jgi:threonine synthase
LEVHGANYSRNIRVQFLGFDFPAEDIISIIVRGVMAILPVCSKCGTVFPSTGAPFLCICGGVFDYLEFPDYTNGKVDAADRSMWKYRAMFGLDESGPVVTLGEGNTPLERVMYGLQPIWLKLESQNPTGSYKDRGSAVLTSFLLSRSVSSVVEDSSGNAGASLAAYAARAGIKARVFVPESASGPKRKQIENYGAELVAIPGPRANAARAVREAVDEMNVYASHAFMPFGLCGIATIAYELVQGLGGKAPGTVIAPVGHGGLLYGVIRGFKALVKATVVNAEPYYVGVQASGCAPVFSAYNNQEFTLREPQESDTIAEGVRVKNPIRGEAILRAIDKNRGRIMQVNELELLKAYADIARKGFFVEPTSALPWAALGELVGKVPEPIVLILTGSGYKTQF